MTNEDWEKVERTMAFLLESAAKHDANITRLGERLEQTEALAKAALQSIVRMEETFAREWEKINAAREADREEHRATREADWRIIREVIQDMKDVVHGVSTKTDRANRRLDALEPRVEWLENPPTESDK